MEESLINSIDEYYNLKNLYNKQFIDLKKKLRKNTLLSKVDKRAQFQNFQPKCVNCKKPGVTIFTNIGKVLKAKCGSTEPCKLDIEINEGNYASIISLDENYTKNIDSIKTKIIMTKLDFLFGYTYDESVAFDNFDKLRKMLGKYTEAQLLVQRHYNEVAHNVKKQEDISKSETKLYDVIDELKNTYKLYRQNPKASYIVDMVEKYINIIQPMADKIRNEKYVVTTIEIDNDTDIAYLIEKEYTLNELEQEVYGETKSGVVKNVK